MAAGGELIGAAPKREGRDGVAVAGEREECLPTRGLQDAHGAVGAPGDEIDVTQAP